MTSTPFSRMIRSRVAESFLEVDSRVDEEHLHRQFERPQHVAHDAARFLHGRQGRDAVPEHLPRPMQQFLGRTRFERFVELSQIRLRQPRHSSFPKSNRKTGFGIAPVF